MQYKMGDNILHAPWKLNAKEASIAQQYNISFRLNPNVSAAVLLQRTKTHTQW